MAKTTYKNDPLYLALKKALAVANDQHGEMSAEALTVQGAITSIRHEFAWADPDSPLEKTSDGMTDHRFVPKAD